MVSSPEKRRPSIFWPLAAIVLPSVSLIAKIKVEGKLPQSGSFVLAPNHTSELDPLITAVSVWRLGRLPRYMGKASLFKLPVVGALLRWSGQIPVSRESGAAAAQQTMKQADQLVQSGSGVIVYPEGTLTRDPDLWPMRGKTGAVRLALAGGLDLYPMAQWGTETILPPYGKLKLWPLRRPVTVKVGEPLDLSEFRGREHDPKAMAQATTKLMNAITALLEAERGITAPEVRWNPADHGQSSTGRLDG